MADIVVALINRRNTSNVNLDCLLTSTFIATRKIIRGLVFGLDAFVSSLGFVMVGVWHFHFQIYFAKNELTSRPSCRNEWGREQLENKTPHYSSRSLISSNFRSSGRVARAHRHSFRSLLLDVQQPHTHRSLIRC